jgi:hypothetical protein
VDYGDPVPNSYIRKNNYVFDGPTVTVNEARKMFLMVINYIGTKHNGDLFLKYYQREGGAFLTHVFLNIMTQEEFLLRPKFQTDELYKEFNASRMKDPCFYVTWMHDPAYVPTPKQKRSSKESVEGSDDEVSVGDSCGGCGAKKSEELAELVAKLKHKEEYIDGIKDKLVGIKDKLKRAREEYDSINDDIKRICTK